MNLDYQNNGGAFEQNLSLIRYFLRLCESENDNVTIIHNTKTFIANNWVFKLFNKTISPLEESALLTEINKLLHKHKVTSILKL